jgi:tetratricopeptide (TPR) repeat protein
VKRLLLTSVAGALSLLAFASPAVGDSSTQSRLESPDRIDPQAMMALICAGRPDSVLTIANSPKYRDSADPLVHLLAARALRDLMCDEDADKDLIKLDAEPIHERLDRAIKICDKALEHQSPPLDYYYFRGRAWLGKAQLYTLTHSYWSAGRSAARAKGDLEHVLEEDPNNADAQGDLGAFLYFADTLPGVIKFLSKLLFIPSGDRERGLNMLHYAAQTGSRFSPDPEITIAAIYLLFEGRFEDGSVAMKRLIDLYPGYTRLVEPFGVVAPLYPTKIREFQSLEDRVIAYQMSKPQELVNWSLVKRIQLHRSYANMLFGYPQRAFFEISSMIENPVERPDWFLPLALVNRGHLYAKQGDEAAALQDFERILSNERMEHFHKLADGLVESLESPWKHVALSDLDFVAAIYDGRLSAAREGLTAYHDKYHSDVLYFFYLGETEMMSRNFVDAARAYQSCIEQEVHGGDETYQLFAMTRLGEIHGHEGRYDTAAEYFDKATDFTHAGFLFDFMLHARKRYYELLEDGTIDVQPTLLLQQSMGGNTPPLTTNQ